MLKLINISYKIDSKIIIEDINLEFNNGLYALIGLNGAGKTTLINIITTLKSPTKGDIIYNKKSALENPLILRENLGYMSQNIGLIQDFTVFQNIYYFGLLKGCERKTGPRSRFFIGVTQPYCLRRRASPPISPRPANSMA